MTNPINPDMPSGQPYSPPPPNTQPFAPSGSVPPIWAPGPPQPQPNSGLAITSLVLGLTGLIVSWFTFGIPSLLALIFGIIGIRQTGDGPGKRAGRGMAVAGTVLGGVILVLGIYVSAVLIYSVGSAANDLQNTAPAVCYVDATDPSCPPGFDPNVGG